MRGAVHHSSSTELPQQPHGLEKKMARSEMAADGVVLRGQVQSGNWQCTQRETKARGAKAICSGTSPSGSVGGSWLYRGAVGLFL